MGTYKPVHTICVAAALSATILASATSVRAGDGWSAATGARGRHFESGEQGRVCFVRHSSLTLRQRARRMTFGSHTAYRVEEFRRHGELPGEFYELDVAVEKQHITAPGNVKIIPFH